MRKLIICAIALLALTGCAEIQKAETTISNAIGVIGSTKVNSKSAYIAINVFNAAERSATAYLKLPRCDGVLKVCRMNAAAAALGPSFNAGIQARNDLRAYMRANKGTLADAGLYNTLIAATTSLQNVMNIYGIGK